MLLVEIYIPYSEIILKLPKIYIKIYLISEYHPKLLCWKDNKFRAWEPIKMPNWRL